eukprot:514787-Rhodomonas_salina.1
MYWDSVNGSSRLGTYRLPASGKSAAVMAVMADMARLDILGAARGCIKSAAVFATKGPRAG